MFLATARPSTRTEADRIILTVPSGSQDVEIALTVHEAMFAAQKLLRAASKEMDAARPTAEVVPFRRRA